MGDKKWSCRSFFCVEINSPRRVEKLPRLGPFIFPYIAILQLLSACLQYIYPLAML